jgi:hypothetical protein
VEAIDLMDVPPRSGQPPRLQSIKRAILKEQAKKSPPHARIIVGLFASNPFDLVPGNGKGSYDRLGLPHCEEGINPPARIIALNNGTSDHSSDGGFSSIWERAPCRRPGGPGGGSRRA